MRALTIRQPWAWLIVHGHKDVENRSWSTRYRGPLLIHAASALARRDSIEEARFVCNELGILLPDLAGLRRGGVVGIATLTDCVRAHPSPWFDSGAFGFALADARPLPFRRLSGRLGFFEIDQLRLTEREISPPLLPILGGASL